MRDSEKTPYVPDLHPTELVRNCLKTAYSTRYGNSDTVSDFLREFLSRPLRTGFYRLCAAQ